MKKLMSLVAAVIFLTGMVVAQNTATTNQTGDLNNATQYQEGAGNVAQTDQNTPGANVVYGQTAEQWQWGVDNMAHIEQNTWGSEAEGNYSYQDQYGMENEAKAKTNGSNNYTEQWQGWYDPAYENYSRIFVGGSENYAGSYQEGIDNWDVIEIHGDMNNMGAYIEQIGEENDATIKIVGNMNDAMIMQYGMWNTAGPRYFAYPIGIHIEGDENYAYTEQWGYQNNANYWVKGTNNWFYGYQGNWEKTEPMGNDMKIDQYNWHNAGLNHDNYVYAYQYGDKNDIDALIKGDRNYIDFYQEGLSNVIMGFGNDPSAYGSYSPSFTETPFMFNGDDGIVYITQWGQYNMVMGDIKGNNQYVNIYQESADMIDDNHSEVYIEASFGNPSMQTVDVWQVGENESYVTIYGDGNDVDHMQYGTDNEATPYKGINTAGTYIEGNYNISYIDQEGENGDIPETLFKGAMHDIFGHHNMASTEQDGYGNWAYVSQEGDENTAIQAQDAWTYGGYEAIDDNEANYNISAIYQYGGDYNFAETYQSGDFNVIVIDQWGSSNTATVDQGLWDQRPYATPMHGSYNDGYIYQQGTGQNATLYQAGSWNNSTIVQITP